MAQTTTSRRLIVMPSSSASVLLIDNDSQVRSDTCAQLKAAGFDVYQCSHLYDAFSLITQAQPSCIVTELTVDDGTAVDLLRYLHKNASSADVIVFTSTYQLADVVRIIKCGAVDCIDKKGSDSKGAEAISAKAASNAAFEELLQGINRCVSDSHDIAMSCATDDVLISLNRELRENVHMLERDQAAGRLVQQKLSPKTPLNVAHLDIGYKIFPSLELSGDSIDYGFLGERFLAFYLTDVSGHGAASAFVAVWVKQLVRSLFRDKALFRSRKSFENDAPMLMQHINQELIDAGLNQHLTCFVGVIDTQENDMIYVVGGHLPLPILIAGAETVYLQGGGKPLGLFEGAEWLATKVSLPRSFSLIVFSDGILEVLSGCDLVEKEALLLGSMTGSESVSLDSVIKTLNLKESSALPDDIAMLLISQTE